MKSRFNAPLIGFYGLMAVVLMFVSQAEAGPKKKNAKKIVYSDSNAVLQAPLFPVSQDLLSGSAEIFVENSLRKNSIYISLPGNHDPKTTSYVAIIRRGSDEVLRCSMKVVAVPRLLKSITKIDFFALFVNAKKYVEFVEGETGKCSAALSNIAQNDLVSIEKRTLSGSSEVAVGQFADGFSSQFDTDDSNPTDKKKKKKNKKKKKLKKQKRKAASK